MELGVFESPEKEWDEFASRYTDLIFYQSVWSQVLRRGLGGQPLYFYLREGGEIVAGLPGVLLDFKILKILYASIPYGNLIGEKPYYSPFMEILERAIREKGIGQVRMTESPFSKGYSPDTFQSVSAKCSLLDLRGFDKERILESHKKYVRRDIRKAQRSGVTIRSGTSGEDARIFHRLYLASMERNKAVAKYPSRWFEAICEEMAERGLGTFLFAELDKAAIAGMVLINSTTTTHYMHSGSQNEFFKFCPNELLVHSALEGAIERGNSYFDFMGSDPADLSLIKFKEKWGSQSLDIQTYVKDYHPIRCQIWEWGKRFGNSKIGDWLLKIIRPSQS
jgi:lipid II:glycine glycyltransferase (peptidoglycan interpeptide bridge formation enzyme)